MALPLGGPFLHAAICLSIFDFSPGATSPGPDFAIVTRHALTGSRKAALFATLGIATALIVHITYCALGIGLLLVESHLAFRIVQVAGSCYLAYLGIRMLLPSKATSPHAAACHRRAFLSGFLTNLLNPKAALFILGLFSQFVNPHTPLAIVILYGLTMSFTALLWFGILSFLITHPSFRPYFARFQAGLTRAMGVLLIFLALWVVVTSFS